MYNKIFFPDIDSKDPYRELNMAFGKYEQNFLSYLKLCHMNSNMNLQTFAPVLQSLSCSK